MRENKVIVIAEAGVNHNGSLSLAKKIIDKAAYAKADYIKFQYFNPNKITTKWSKTANYQKKNCKIDNQHKLLSKLSLSIEQLKLLEDYSKKKKIKFMLSIFDDEDVNILKLFKIDFIKIPSGEINNFVLLRKISNLKKKIILSTGGSTTKEIKEAVIFLQKNRFKKNKLSLLHCVTNYPSSLRSMNLKSILYLKNFFKCAVGLSDHSLGDIISIAAVAIGAEIIEKHITLNKSMKGPDHKSSLEPQEFKLMVQKIRNIELSLGKERKIVQEEEKKNITLIRKSIVAKNVILKGEKFTEENICLKRPGTGLSSKFWKKIIGKKAKKFFMEDELII